MVPGGRTQIAIGYKYSTRKFLSFIVIEDAWITKKDLTYLYNYLKLFYNADIRPVARPLVMSKFFGSINEVYYHKKSR